MDYSENTVQSIGQKSYRFVNFELPMGSCDLVAGPYMDKPEEFPGVKLAQEMYLTPCAIDLPIKDFSVPHPKDLERAVYATMSLMWAGATPYVGCMGGKGRTGLFLGVLAKVALRSTRSLWAWRSHTDPVEWIRANYRVEACETAEQQEYVRGFDTRWLEHAAKMLK